MSALRLCALAVCIVGLASAASYSGAGCPTATQPAPWFGNASVTCAKATACEATFCSCIGAAAPTNWTCGAFTTSAPNCSVTIDCTAAKIKCINAAADDVNAGCANLKELKMSNLAVAGGQLYNDSAAYMACKHEACKIVNATGGNCTVDYDKLCESPVRFIGTLRLKGNWGTILNDVVKKAALHLALEHDLKNALGFAVKVLRTFLKCSKRRVDICDLIVEFEAKGVSINNASLKKNLEAVKDGAFLTETLVAYKATNGATASFEFKGIASGSSSSAVFSASGSGSAAATSSSSTSTTTTGSATGSATGSGSNGAATQSLLAAVVVAVIGAMMF